ncbi:periplasmic binding protein [Solidesulfovibrio fructosivorans JJ]]|uniref:Periplasmic binding protein n=1 Tax=Solidesulfovibrio fructosivorans JJ] TaxID=596151 RepID=E1JWT0_SOLFR|nr:ABC transporter substrate-binding protein [Solidesulfovibrio fructosivorans]EFL51134.1 periplasmic binding protein [Solidesulfovibrio fructosivorans JJ]]
MLRTALRRTLPLAAALLVCLLTLAATAPAMARTVTDMTKKTVTIPDAPKKVYALSPPDSLLVYAIDPCVLAGWNFKPFPPAKAFMPACAANLPVLGGFFGKGMVPNKEALLAAKPDLVVSGTMASSNREFDKFFIEIGIPVVHIDSESPDNYPADFRFLGEALGKKERGEALAAAADKTLAELRAGLAKIPQDKRLTVYYAEGGDGLYTDGADSFHTMVIKMAGGVNVHKKPQSNRFGMDKVSMETVMGYAPQAILVQDAKCRDMILSSPLWKDIPAVKAGRVFLIPDAPFNWFDRPPSFMRLLGAKWAAHALYPKVFPYDMVKETQAFLKLYLQKDISADEAKTLLAGKNPHRK